MSLSIVIPCRNEENNINLTIDKITDYLNNKIADYELNLINDFSTDNTYGVITNISKINNSVKVYNNLDEGLGGAINLGIKVSTKKFMVIVMADLSDSPEDILNYYIEIKKKDLDAVFGSRFTSQSKLNNYPLKKRILNRIFNNFVKIIFWEKYNDFTNAFKIYRVDALKEIKPIVSENFNVFLELPLKIIIRGYKYSIIPIDWQNRKLGEAKFKLQELGSKYIFTLLYCFLEKILLKKKAKNINGKKEI
jgi:dolichol-phosphate mannosyltransferase